MIVRSLLIVMVLALVGCRVTVEVAPSAAPERRAAPEVRGLVFLREGQIHLQYGREERLLGALPEGWQRAALGKYYLAYVHEARVEALSLAHATTHTLYRFPERTGADWDLLWGKDGLVLAYAFAWDEEDGSRVVETGDVLVDALRRHAMGIVARPAGPTPTPPSEPGHPPPPGFANLALLGFDQRTGLLAATPVGGAARYAAVWLYDLDDHRRVGEIPLPEPKAIVQLAASPDLRWLAVSHQEGEKGVLSVRPLWAHPGDQPVPQEPRVLSRYAGEHITDLAWSPEGRRLAYVRREGLPRLDVSPAVASEVADLATGDVLAVRLDGAAEIRLLRGWTGDGRALVVHVVGGLPEENVAALVDAATGETVHISLPPGAVPLGWLGEAPDGPQG